MLLNDPQTFVHAQSPSLMVHRRVKSKSKVKVRQRWRLCLGCQYNGEASSLLSCGGVIPDPALVSCFFPECSGGHPSERCYQRCPQ